MLIFHCLSTIDFVSLSFHFRFTLVSLSSINISPPSFNTHSHSHCHKSKLKTPTFLHKSKHTEVKKYGCGHILTSAHPHFSTFPHSHILSVSSNYSPLEGVRGVEPSFWEGRVRLLFVNFTFSPQFVSGTSPSKIAKLLIIRGSAFWKTLLSRRRLAASLRPLPAPPCPGGRRQYADALQGGRPSP